MFRFLYVARQKQIVVGIYHIHGYGGVAFHYLQEQVNIIILTCENKLTCSFCPKFDFLLLLLGKLIYYVVGYQRTNYDYCNEQQHDDDVDYIRTAYSHNGLEKEISAQR